MSNVKKFLIVLGTVLFTASICAVCYVEYFEKWTPLLSGEGINLTNIKYAEQMEIIGVYGTIDEVYGYYYESTDGTYKNYVMKAGENNYIGIRVKDDDYRMDKLISLSVKRLMGENVEKELKDAKFKIRGVIRKNNNTEESYYLKFADKYPLEGGRYLNYYIDVIDLKYDILGPLFALFFFLGLGFWILYSILIGGYRKDIRKYIAQKTSTEYEKEKINRFFKNAPYIYKLQYDSEFICKRSGINTMFLETQKIVQIYKKTKLHRYKLILPLYKSNELVFVTEEGKRKTVDFATEKQVDEAIEKLASVCRNAVIGKK